MDLLFVMSSSIYLDRTNKVSKIPVNALLNYVRYLEDPSVGPEPERISLFSIDYEST